MLGSDRHRGGDILEYRKRDDHYLSRSQARYNYIFICISHLQTLYDAGSDVVALKLKLRSPRAQPILATHPSLRRRQLQDTQGLVLARKSYFRAIHLAA